MASERRVDIVLKARDEASKVFNNVATNALPQFAKTVAGMAVSFASVSAVIDVLKTAAANALEAEQAVSDLTAALNAQKLSVQANIPHLTAFAGAMSRLTKATDEEIEAAQRILISIGGLSGAKLDQATKSVLDLAAGMGIAIPDAADKVARAANGAVRGFTQLGVKFHDNATDAEKLNTVLAFIDRRFGGAAQAQVETMAGKIGLLTKSFGELLEALGQRALGGTAQRGALDKITDFLNALTKDVAEKGFLKTFRELQKAGDLDFKAIYDLFDRMERLRIDDSVTALFSGPRKDKEGALFSLGLDDADPVLEKYKQDVDAIIQAQEDAKKVADAFTATLNKQNAALDTAVALRLRAFNDQLNQTQPIVGRGSAAVIQPGIDSAAADVTAAESIDAQVNAVIALSRAVGTVEEAWAAVESVQQAISDATPEESANLIKMGAALLRTTKIAEKHAENVKVLQDAATAAAQQLGATMVSAAFGAKVAWGEAFKQILEGFVQAIIQALILRLIATIVAAASGGGVVGSGVGASVPAVAGGGVVPTYAARGVMTPRGTDTVPAMLTPGEIVLPRGISQSILNGRASVVPAGRGGSQPTVVNVHLGGEVLTRLLIRNSQSVVEVQEYIDARRG